MANVLQDIQAAQSLLRSSLPSMATSLHACPRDIVVGAEAAISSQQSGLLCRQPQARALLLTDNVVKKDWATGPLRCTGYSRLIARVTKSGKLKVYCESRKYD
nr:hypothetical protein CFP56_07987 [Quercus suber]